MKYGLTVLSLFDGMSCFQISLKELGIPISKYYASEIDKFAIQQTQHNFPNTIQIGSVVDIDVSALDHIDFIAGGSPCQSFSFAGKRAGMSTKCNEEIYTLERYLELKSEGFEFEGQSYLFWEYMRILTEVRKYNPDVKFLLENVEMGNKWERVLSEAIGVFGVHINSSLVSAQNRKRIYWTNIRVKEVGLFGELHSDILQPNDRGILLRHILESDVDGKYYIKNPKFGFEGMDINRKGNTLRTGVHQSQSDKHNYDIIKLDVKGNAKPDQDKASCFTAEDNSGGNHSDMDLIAFNCNREYNLDKSVTLLSRYHKGMANFGGDTFICVAQRGRNPDNPKSRKSGLPTEQMLEPNILGKTNCLTSVSKDNLIMQLGRGFNKGGFHEEKSPSMTSNSWEQNNLVIQLNSSKESGGKQPFQQNRVYADYGKSPCLDTDWRKSVSHEQRIRRLTPTECARLQTIPDWYEWIVSDTQQYKMLGNGWTVEVIKHILSFLTVSNKEHYFKRL